MKSLARLWFVGSLVLILAGCGFEMRTEVSDLAPTKEPRILPKMCISSHYAPYDPIVVATRKYFLIHQWPITDSPEDAAWTLTIEPKHWQQNFSFLRAGANNNYPVQVNVSLTYQLTNQRGEVLIDHTTIVKRGEFSQNLNAINSTEIQSQRLAQTLQDQLNENLFWELTHYIDHLPPPVSASKAP